MESQKIIIYGVEYNNPDTIEWTEDKIEDMPMKEEQYQIFLKGFCPDWDFRYAPFQYQGWYYITRSGCWVKKFRYEKQRDGLYHLMEHYASERGFLGSEYNILLDMFIYGYFEPRLRDVIEKNPNFRYLFNR